MPEQFIFKQLIGQCRTIDRNKRVVLPGAGVVNRAGKHFLPGPGFTLQQHRRIHIGEEGNLLNLCLKHRALPHQRINPHAVRPIDTTRFRSLPGCEDPPDSQGQFVSVDGAQDKIMQLRRNVVQELWPSAILRGEQSEYRHVRPATDYINKALRQ